MHGNNFVHFDESAIRTNPFGFPLDERLSSCNEITDRPLHRQVIRCELINRPIFSGYELGRYQMEVIQVSFECQPEIRLVSVNQRMNKSTKRLQGLIGEYGLVSLKVA